MEMTAKGLGMTAVVDDAGRPVGVFTDGDLRRCLDRGVDVRDATAAEVMTPGGKRIAPDRLAVEALNLMEDKQDQRACWWSTPTSVCAARSTCTTCCAQAWSEQGDRRHAGHT